VRPIKKERKKKKLTSRQVSALVAKAAEDKKAKDIKIIDVRKSSDLTDFFVIVSGESSPQLKAILKGIEEGVNKLRKLKQKWEGSISSNWLILDLGDVIVHIMGEEERKRYKLEDLWQKSAIIYHE